MTCKNCERLREEIAQLKLDRVEVGRLCYLAGHDDTVESRFGDALETAQDICLDLEDERLDKEAREALQPTPEKPCEPPYMAVATWGNRFRPTFIEETT